MVRNFYLRGGVDGRSSPVTGGPRRRDGGMRLHLTQRAAGCIAQAFTIEAYADGERLVTVVYDHTGTPVARRETVR